MVPGVRLVCPFVLLASLAAQTVDYTYDKAGRLVRADYGGGKAILYTYDPAGNLLKRERAAGGNTFTTLSSASLERGGAIAPGSIASGFGQGLAAEVLIGGAPLPEELGGARIEITDSQGGMRKALLFFVSPTQINYLVPAATALGKAAVRVFTASGGTVDGTFQVERVAPGIYAATGSGSGAAAAFYLRAAADGSRSQNLVFDPPTRATVPIDLGPSGDQVYLLLFGTGVSGHSGDVTASVGGVSVPVLGAVPQGEFPGEDQINIGPLPRSLAGRGDVDIVLTVDGKRANLVRVNIR